MKRFAAALALGFLVAAGSASAQTRVPDPIERPSAGFKPDRYIDSGGCAFARVVLGETEVWAPQYRSNGGRDCGYLPSFSEPGSEARVAGRARPVTGLEQPGYYIQAGAFGRQSNIDRIKERFTANGWGAASRPAGRLTLVFAGPFYEAIRAGAALRTIRRSGMPDAYLVVQKKPATPETE